MGNFRWHVRKTFFLAGLSDGLFFSISAFKAPFYWMGVCAGLSVWVLVMFSMAMTVSYCRGHL